ncbi:methylated-DNA--[protein]-cysteine S-methyltransferase [Pectinatus haikarae]|uniref:Methylated-DNA-[protein]-cysteine S-methyltransferase n=1 Tax=Pectinatus haikarae TaxID=349096 RepID=A0ABT9Y9S8_9FIRM|nr:methylated-DNA--[protein]-cysteine S-methyltransferase [Pectinatus haikarae]MDQ0204286.1 methylated-DNA-[protein]-cysteine S-methyltransferase [Pectinatus haikarae]
MKKRFVYQTKIGNIYITEEKSFITGISYHKPFTPALETETLLIRETYMQITEYLSGVRKGFLLPLRQDGTAFQKKIWEALLQIPYGYTCSYGELAAAVGKPKAIRAVETAKNKNHIDICIPSHRLVNEAGILPVHTRNIKVKKFLLELEHKNV